VAFLNDGTRIGGRYRIETLLGRGGMGQVYRAVDEQLGRLVAVKVLPPEFTADAGRLRRFMTEARAASALNHPNIVTVHEVGEATVDGTRVHFLVTELIEGTTLREHLVTRPSELAANVALLAQVADGLAKAHAAGIVHRDLKPENVMITADGFAKIVDFGLAKLAGLPEAGDGATVTLAQQTHPGAVLGTVGYMSPEQVRGDVADPRSDIFSAGAILWELATGERAFRGDTSVDTLHAILHGDPFATGGVPPELERPLRKSLAKDPERRYARARDLADDLREAARALESSPPRRSVKWNRAAAAATLVLLAVVAAIALRTRLPFRAVPRAIDSVAVLPFENRSGDPDLDYLGEGITESLINELGRVSGVRVISRSSVFRYAGSKDDPAAIARGLQVAAAVAGRVQRRGGRYTISVELVSSGDGTHLWGEQYDVAEGRLHDVQEDIARRVCDRLAWRLPAPAAAGGARDADVYRLYLRGRYHLNRRAPAELRTAIDYYDQAIARQPGFAPAHAGRADAYALLVNTNAFPARQGLPEVSRSATRALQLDPSNEDAHLALAYLRANEYRWDDAEEELRRALAVNPGSSSAWQRAAVIAVTRRRFGDAIAAIDRALVLDPFALPINNASCVVRYLAGRYDEAVVAAQRAIALDPTFASVHRFLSRTYVEQGRHADALREAQTYARLAPSAVATADLAIVYARSGDRRRAMEIGARLETLATSEYVPPVDMGALAVALGEHDAAFAWLERGFAARADALTVLAVDPRFAPLRADPRFTRCLERLRLR
jgi:serine/threonine protein kinase/Tfp pilus assembly protein PilF